jgi:hypothetical protein
MKNASPGPALKAFVLCTFLFMVAMNVLAVLLPLNGVTPGEVSDSYPNLFAPAGAAFAIWTLIYLLLAAHTLYQLGWLRGPGTAPEGGLPLSRIAVLFSLSSLANAAWIFAWHYRRIPLSMLLMATLLILLIAISHLLDAEEFSLRESLLVRLPFFVYFGWITVATLANAASLLVSLGWDGFGIAAPVWTIAVLAAGALIGSGVLLRSGSIAYGLVLIWAYSGILVKHLSPAGFGGRYPGVALAAGICIVAFAAGVVYILACSGQSRQAV